MKEKVSIINQLKNDFVAQAQSWQLAEKVMPSDTNFVLIKLNNQLDAEQVMQTFLANKLLLRNQSKQLMLENAIRITIGSETEMNKVIDIFNQIEQQLTSLNNNDQ